MSQRYNIRSQPGDQGISVTGTSDPGLVDDPESRNDRETVILRHDWLSFFLQGYFVAGHDDDQPVTQSPGLRQVEHMPGVEEVKDARGEDRYWSLLHTRYR